MAQNPNVQTMKMFSIVVRHSLHNCSIFRTIDPDEDSSGQITLTIVALMVLLRSMWILLCQERVMIRSLLRLMPTNTVEWVVAHRIAGAKTIIRARKKEEPEVKKWALHQIEWNASYNFVFVCVCVQAEMYLSWENVKQCNRKLYLSL